MKDVNEMTRQELEAKLQFNGVHHRHKEAMIDSDLALLAIASYVDVSWGNDECASFMSPCGHYQVFFGEHCDLDCIYAQHVCDEGYVTPLITTNDMLETLCKLRDHSLYGEA